MPKAKKVIGLTGSIGMGKSTVARMFFKCGALLISADDIVRTSLAHNLKVHSFFKENYPEVFHAGRISRKRVGAILFSSPASRKKIETFLHPLVKKEMSLFIKKSRTQLIVLEVPLLFETGFDLLCDVTVCVSATPQQQKRRVMKRGRMSEAQYQTVLKRQYSDKTKRARADYIIDSSVSQSETRAAVQKLYKDLCL